MSALSATDTNLVWVGTGEGNGRNSSSWGNGVYKSTDSVVQDSRWTATRMSWGARLL